MNLEQLNDANGTFGSSGALVGGNGSTVLSLGSNSAIYACEDTEDPRGCCPVQTYYLIEPLAPTPWGAMKE